MGLRPRPWGLRRERVGARLAGRPLRGFGGTGRRHPGLAATRWAWVRLRPDVPARRPAADLRRDGSRREAHDQPPRRRVRQADPLPLSRLNAMTTPAEPPLPRFGLYAHLPFRRSTAHSRDFTRPARGPVQDG